MDAFVQRHRQLLGQRLFRQSPELAEGALRVEEEFIAVLSRICGEEEVRNMTKMIADLRSSRDSARSSRAAART
jgi:hypothetical protein